MTSEKSEDQKCNGYVYINMQFGGLILIDRNHAWEICTFLFWGTVSVETVSSVFQLWQLLMHSRLCNDLVSLSALNGVRSCVGWSK